MDAVKIIALMIAALILALVLDGRIVETKLPQIYLNIENTSSREEEQGSITLIGKNSVRDVGMLVKMRGNSTIWTDKKSYSIRFIKKTSLLGMEKSNRWVLVGLPFDKSMIRTAVAFEYAQAIGMRNISPFTFCDLYINDEYRGMYMLMQAITLGGLSLNTDKGDFILERNMYRKKKGHHYVVTEGGIRFEINAGDLADDAHREACLSFINRAEAAIQTGNQNHYEQWIDVDSFVNAYIAQEVTKHIDFAQYSDRYYVKDGRLYAGPLWDLDLSMGNVSMVRENDMVYQLYNNDPGYGDSSQESTSAFWAQRDWYEWLCQDPNFMRRVCKRWREIYPITENLVYENELGKSRIDKLAEQYAEELAANYDEKQA